MRILKLFILAITLSLFFTNEMNAQTFKCVDVTFNKNDSHSTNQRLEIYNQLLGSKTVLTVYDNKILAEMYDNNGKRDASFIFEYFDNGFVKGYRYSIPNSSLGAIIIQDITPSIKDIQKFKILTLDLSNGMDITTTYKRMP